jgi:shikimate dehydrogenase
MKQLYVIGDPIAHSLSPLIQNTMISALGLKYEYSAKRVADGDAGRFLVWAKKGGCAGFNATMPHKLALFPLLDGVSEDAALCGAVNTVAVRGGEAYGYNTDGIGFLQGLVENGINPVGMRAAVLGAGGAARAVALKLAQSGCRSVFVLNRTEEKAEAIAREFPGVIQPRGLTGDELGRSAAECDLLVNCTPVGMDGVGSAFESLGFLGELRAGAPVVDIVYRPSRTALLAAAEKAGHPVLNGLPMLTWQALFALERFTETKIDASAVLPKVRAALAERGIA